jgi:hypothetical protein
MVKCYSKTEVFGYAATTGGIVTVVILIAVLGLHLTGGLNLLMTSDNVSASEGWDKVKYQHESYSVPYNVSYEINIIEQVGGGSFFQGMGFIFGNLTNGVDVLNGLNITNASLMSNSIGYDHFYININKAANTMQMLLDFCTQTNNNYVDEWLAIAIDTAGRQQFMAPLADYGNGLSVALINATNSSIVNVLNATGNPAADGALQGTILNGTVIVGFGHTFNSNVNHRFYKVELPLNEMNYTTNSSGIITKHTINLDWFGIQFTHCLDNSQPANWTLPTNLPDVIATYPSIHSTMDFLSALNLIAQYPLCMLLESAFFPCGEAVPSQYFSNPSAFLAA